MRLVADTNVLLSAIAGGRAIAVIEHHEVEEVLAPQVVLAEVCEYLSSFARKRGLSEDVLLTALATLPVAWVDRSEYEKQLPEAGHRMGSRDPDDIDTLALALHLGIPVWSNDRDFDGTGIQVYPTARLLSRLGVRRRRD